MEMKPMMRSTPEREGIPSAAIEAYLQGILDEKLTMHSLMVVRHGKIVYEKYWKPFDENFRHRLYSCSKSFTAVAVGYLIGQGLLSLDDKIVKFFPDKLAGRTVDPYLEQCTIRDLLRMSSAYTNGANYSVNDPDWAETFFTDDVSHVPGTVFSYCTSGTTILCHIIKRVTGKNFIEVLRPVFDEIGVGEEIFCVESPDGVEWGGSGVCATPREFAKFANLCMHRGNHEGKQLIPYDYMLEATTRQIDNSLYANSDDLAQGYGYQFWMMRNGGFAFYGMGGQYALCFPEKDLIIVTTGYEELMITGRKHAIFSNLWTTIFPAVCDEALPEDAEANARLEKLGDGLELEHVNGEADSPMRADIEGKWYYMRENAMGMKKVKFDFDGENGVMCYENASGYHELRFGMCKNVKQEFPEMYSGKRIATPYGKGYDSYNSAAWTMPDSLMMHFHIADIYLGQLRMIAAFKGDTITLHGLKHAEWFIDDYQGFASGRRL
ncbi:MAG: beta-lactamase family protein [Clostridia bacterium]|nr:beta-lactamase family protein [Clostridia bacterium]